MNSSVNSPKEPSKVIGWGLIAIAVIISMGSMIISFLVGNEIGGGIGGGLQGISAVLFFVIPYKIITYGRRRMAERAENLIDLD